MVRAFSLQDLYREADGVVLGTVESSRSFWNDAHDTIYTEYEVAVDRTVKGSEVKRVTVRLMGGRVADRELVVSGNPDIADRERLLLFLRDSGEFRTVVGMSQGKWSVRTLDGQELAWRGPQLGNVPKRDGEVPVEELLRRCRP
jgi:hypothetical protein